MDILPAIDLMEGRVVRLAQGDYDRSKIYATEPADVARGFLDTGSHWIHVVDLDAARSGLATNIAPAAAIRAAARERDGKVQLGGGARNRETIDAMLAERADRVVIGSAALKDWAWFESLLADDSLPNEQLVLGLDARDGKLAIHGWTDRLDLEAEDLAGRVRGSGLGAIVYTDISRDGMLSGANLEATRRVVEATDVPVIASGGVSSLDDIRGCREIGCGGAILGKALYEGTVALGDALAAATEGA